MTLATRYLLPTYTFYANGIAARGTCAAGEGAFFSSQQTRIEQERRAGVIHHLLNEANKQGEPSNVEGPAKETAHAK